MRLTLARKAARMRNSAMQRWLGCDWCQHHVMIAPRELADRHGLDMQTPLLMLSRALRCTRCGERKGHACIEPHGYDAHRSGKQRGRASTEKTRQSREVSPYRQVAHAEGYQHHLSRASIIKSCVIKSWRSCRTKR